MSLPTDPEWAMEMLEDAGERLQARCQRLEVIRENVGLLLLTASEGAEILDALRMRRGGDSARRLVLIQELEAFLDGIEEVGDDADS